MHRNDEITIDAVEAMKPDRIVISPGPGRPEDAGITPTIRRLGSTTRFLASGASGNRHGAWRHGLPREHANARKDVHSGARRQGCVQRHHRTVPGRSLPLLPSFRATTCPKDIEVAARTKEDGIIMAVRHRTYPVHGVQFHPESVLTNEGRRILQNFLEL